jgi:hypothetical protein
VGGLDGQVDLAAHALRCLEQHHVMAALGADARCLEPSRSRARYGHALLPRAFGDDVGHRGFPARRGILQAQGAAAGIQAVDAIGGAHALADVVGASLHKLADDMGIGDVAARHADHVQMAVFNGAGGGG